MNAQDPLVRGERLGDQFSYHVLDTMGPPLVHTTRSYRAEIVLFGHDQRLVTPFVVEAGKNIMLTGKDDHVTVSHFAPDQPDQKRVVSTTVDDCIRAIVELGGTYPDVVQALQQARSSGALTSRLEVDAIPTAGRLYDRGGPVRHDDSGDEESINDESPSDDDHDHASQGVAVANPLPGLFDSGQKTLDKRPVRPASEPSSDSEPDQKKARSTRSWLSTIGQ